MTVYMETLESMYHQLGKLSIETRTVGTEIGTERGAEIGIVSVTAVTERKIGEKETEITRTAGTVTETEIGTGKFVYTVQLIGKVFQEKCERF